MVDHELSWLTSGSAAGPEKAAGSRLMLATVRRLAARQESCPTLHRDYAVACGDDGCQVYLGVRAFLGVAAQAAGRRLDVAPLGWGELTGDEHRLLALLAAVQRHEPQADRLLAILSRPGLRPQLRRAAQALADILHAHGLPVAAPPYPSTPVLTVIPGGWTLATISSRRPGVRLRLVSPQPVEHAVGADHGAAEAGLQQVAAGRRLPVQHFAAGEDAR